MERQSLASRLGPRAGVMAGLVAAHIVLFTVLIHANMGRHHHKHEAKPLVVQLMPELSEPPPPPPATPDPVVLPDVPIMPLISAPEPVVVTEAQPVSYVAVAPPPAPPQAVVVVPKAAQAAAGPVSVPDLAATMIEAEPPRYPLDSRRKREQGAVLLMVLLRADGRVENVSISRSSGFERLDKAALDAVRRWRWSPTMRGGEAVMVRGVVEIPFILRG